jgi:hypothetical protein
VGKVRRLSGLHLVLWYSSFFLLIISLPFHLIPLAVFVSIIISQPAMGLLSFLDAFRSKPRTKDRAIKLESPRRERSVFQESSSRRSAGPVSKTTISGPATELSSPSNASTRRKSLLRRRSWFGGKPDAEEDVPAMPTLIRNDYNSPADLKRPYLGQSQRSNGGEYSQLPSNKRDRRTSTFSNRQDVTTVSALPALPPMPINASNTAKQATSSLPDEQRRNRRASMKSLYRSPSVTSTKSRRKSRSFWASSNPDDESEEEHIPPVPALIRGGTPDSARNTSIEELYPSQQPQQHTRGHSSAKVSGDPAPRPLSTCSRKSYTPRSAAAGFLKSTTGASEDQRKSYRRSFKLGENVELVCVSDEHRVEWEKLMNKNGRLEDAVFASLGSRGEEEEEEEEE